VLEIKEKLKDLPDCVITATAIVYSDLMLTEAEDFRNCFFSDYLLYNPKEIQKRLLSALFEIVRVNIR